MMGYEFATFVNEHLKNQGVATRNIAKIDSNPEKSKHLETATTKLFDRDVDFCNLRTEAYEPDSRIPSQIVSEQKKKGYNHSHSCLLDIWYTYRRCLSS